MNHDSFTRWDTLAQTDLESASKNWGWVLASGIAFVVLGVVALAFSVMTTLASVFAMIGNTQAQIAGSTTLGVAVSELKDITAG